MSEAAAQNHAGGSIKETLAGNASLDIGAVMREAWAKTDGIKVIIFGGYVVFFVGVLVLMTVLGWVMNFDPLATVDRFVLQVLMAGLLYPFLAGVLMTGIRHSVGRPVSIEGLVAYYGGFLTIAGVGVLQSVATSIGFVLLVIPGLYLSIAFVLAIPLHVEKRLGVVDSLMTSLRLVNKKFLEVTVLLVLGALILGITSITIVALFWTLPWMTMILAIIYRQLAGVETGEARAAAV